MNVARPQSGSASAPRSRITPRAARRAFSRFLAYSGNDRIVVLFCALELVRIHWRLKLRGYQATYALTARPHRLAARIAEMPVEEVARLVDAAARWTIGSGKSCLRRAILLTWLLRSAGVQCRLVCGVDKASLGWIGHAWVEIDGVALRQTHDSATEYRLFRDQLSR